MCPLGFVLSHTTQTSDIYRRKPKRPDSYYIPIYTSQCTDTPNRTSKPPSFVGGNEIITSGKNTRWAETGKKGRD